MEDRQEEQQPLLNNQAPPDYTNPASSVEREERTVPPIGADEVLPTYSSSNEAPMITCRVCQAMIDISEKKGHHVVKCNMCQEATPIRNAPPGKKYVRCPCNCLLICKSTSQRIACPRPNCKRIINLAPSPVTPPTPAFHGMALVTCAHCSDTFLFKVESRQPARCPHCSRVSSLDRSYARTRFWIYAILGFILLAVGLGVTLGTYKMAASSGGIYVVYVGAFIASLLAFLVSIKYSLWKTSSYTETQGRA